MTAWRQERKDDLYVSAGSSLPARAVSLGLGLVVSACLLIGARAATTERVVVDRYSGLAIGGFDPVAYFVDAKPERGQEDFEASEAGAVWRFRNEGNRASFVAHPEVYRPQFGGYDPIDVARGVSVAGNPLFWLISADRLYLFGRAENRLAFVAEAQRVLRDANARWPAIEQDLSQ
jgi:hypothetical protein